MLSPHNDDHADTCIHSTKLYIYTSFFIFSPNWIRIHGETYHRSEFVIYGFQEDDLPVFGRIDDILVITATPMLSIRLFRTLGINNHLLCYAIEHTHQKVLILLNQLICPDPLSPHQRIGDDNLYIALRSHIPNIADM